jgi:hypothetical protein
VHSVLSCGPLPAHNAQKEPHSFNLYCCRSAADVSALLAGVQYSGLTPLASSMVSKVL